MNDKLYTIKEIADIIGVSKQAIHKKIKQDPLSSSLQQLTTTINNTIYISIDGMELIKLAFVKDSPSTSTININTKSSTVDDNIIDDSSTKLIDNLESQITFLIEQINIKDNQLKEKDMRLDELTHSITDLTERLAILFENSQQLQQNQQMLEAKSVVDDIEEKEVKKSFFQRLFKK
jgi:hypothetical protein